MHMVEILAVERHTAKFSGYTVVKVYHRLRYYHVLIKILPLTITTYTFYIINFVKFSNIASTTKFFTLKISQSIVINKMLHNNIIML